VLRDIFVHCTIVVVGSRPVLCGYQSDCVLGILLSSNRINVGGWGGRRNGIAALLSCFF
jgi:hypothetical protein